MSFVLWKPFSPNSQMHISHAFNQESHRQAHLGRVAREAGQRLHASQTRQEPA